MKKLAIAFVALSFAMTSACKKEEAKKDDKKVVDPKAAPKVDPKAGQPVTPPPTAVKLAPLDLSAGGDDYKGIAMQAPEGATGKAGPGGISFDVKAGDTFQVEVSTSKVDIAARKKEIGENDMNKLKKFHVDTPDAILYESELMGKSEFHFLANVKVGDKEMSCEDTKGPVYSQADAETMLKACQSLAAAGAAPAPAPAPAPEPAKK